MIRDSRFHFWGDPQFAMNSAEIVKGKDYPSSACSCIGLTLPFARIARARRGGLLNEAGILLQIRNGRRCGVRVGGRPV